jgi:hypothetical protein
VTGLTPEQIDEAILEAYARLRCVAYVVAELRVGDRRVNALLERHGLHKRARKKARRGAK